jgi:Heliorhodopsin
MDTARTPPRIPDHSVRNLRLLNLLAAVAHSIQAIVLVILTNDVALSVTANFASGPPGQAPEPSGFEELFSFRLGYAVAAFSALSALFHLIVAGPGLRTYRSELANERNRFRWLEYSLSASLMIVLIAGLTGITDIAALLALFAVNASMILFGWLMETINTRRPARTWTPFVFGCLAGIVPWLAIGVYLLGAGDDVPGFVYGIFVSLFVVFNCFAVVQWLQYRARGGWTDYLRGERWYIVLSFVAKSALAWQVFANVLVD